MKDYQIKFITRKLKTDSYYFLPGECIEKHIFCNNDITFIVETNFKHNNYIRSSNKVHKYFIQYDYADITIELDKFKEVEVLINELVDDINNNINLKDQYELSH